MFCVIRPPPSSTRTATLVSYTTRFRSGPLDWGPVAGGYLATLCLAAAYIAIGLFVSARTDNQIVSLIVTALICCAFYLIGSDAPTRLLGNWGGRSEEHTSELQSLMRISYAVFCLKKK